MRRSPYTSIRRRPRSRSLLALAACATTVALGPVGSAHAVGSGTVTVPTTTEAWYRSAPICDLPTGCPAEPPSPYAADTLHVGVNLGEEEARTLLQLDLTELPAGTKPAGGQLRLPVTDGDQDGTRAPETARMRACPVTEPVTPADGALEDGPDVDCDVASADAVFVAATDDAPAAFTVDLTTLARAWEGSTVPGGLALVPAAETAAPDSWHVALSQRDRAGEDVVPVTATLTYLSAVADTRDVPVPPAPAPADSDRGAGRDAGAPDRASPPTFGSVAPEPRMDPPAPPRTADPAPRAAPPAATPATLYVEVGFDYPGVFLLPLLFAAAAAWLGRALTRDLTAG